MAHQDPGAFLLHDLASKKAECNRKHSELAAEAERYKDLAESLNDIEEIAALWQQLADGPVSHVLFQPGSQLPPDLPAALDPVRVLALMGQEPTRLWRTKDVQAAFAHPSLTAVRAVLKSLVMDGHLTSFQDGSRRVRFKVTGPAHA